MAERTKIVIAYWPPVEGLEELPAKFPQANVVFAGSWDEIAAEAADCQAIVIPGPVYGKQFAAMLNARARQLRWVLTTAVGYDRYLKYPLPDGVVLTRGVGLVEKAVAEHTMAMVLALARNVVGFERMRERREWNRPLATSAMSTLEGRVLGLVGLGFIGRQVALRAKPFEMRILAYSPHVSPAVAEEHGVELVGLGDLLRASDFVSVHTALTAETTHLIGEAELRQMKPSAYLVNVSRGKVVDEAALAAALRERRIRGAALDVFEEEPLARVSPLWDLDNAIISHHVAGHTDRQLRNIARLVRENVARFLRGEPLLYAVDLASEQGAGAGGAPVDGHPDTLWASTPKPAGVGR